MRKRLTKQEKQLTTLGYKLARGVNPDTKKKRCAICQDNLATEGHHVHRLVSLRETKQVGNFKKQRTMPICNPCHSRLHGKRIPDWSTSF